jgi:hypothetical protein
MVMVATRQDKDDGMQEARHDSGYLSALMDLCHRMQRFGGQHASGHASRAITLAHVTPPPVLTSRSRPLLERSGLQLQKSGCVIDDAREILFDSVDDVTALDVRAARWRSR